MSSKQFFDFECKLNTYFHKNNVFVCDIVQCQETYACLSMAIVSITLQVHRLLLRTQLKTVSC